MNFQAFKILTMLAAAFFVASIQCVSAAEPMSKAQLAKLNAVVANQGNAVELLKAVTDSLGVTETNDAPIVRRGIAATDDSSVTYQIHILPGGKGYIVGSISPPPGPSLIYWMDKDLKLISAVVKPRNVPPTRVPIATARRGSEEVLASLAKFVD